MENIHQTETTENKSNEHLEDSKVVEQPLEQKEENEVKMPKNLPVLIALGVFIGLPVLIIVLTFILCFLPFITVIVVAVKGFGLVGDMYAERCKLVHKTRYNKIQLKMKQEFQSKF